MRCTGFAGPADGTGVTASVRDALGSLPVSHARRHGREAGARGPCWAPGGM